VDRRRQAIALLIGAVAAVASVVVAPPALAAPAVVGNVTDPGSPVGPAAVGGFTQSWTRQITPGEAVSTSSPVLVANGNSPFVVAAEVSGRLRAFDLSTGSSIPGWSNTTTGFMNRAPLSSDGSNVYIPVAQDGYDRYPQYKKFNASGSLVWNSNPATQFSPPPGFMLSGMALTKLDGVWQIFAGSSSQFIHSVNDANGSQRWGFLNADSTMATPAIADLYGFGRPQVIFSSDTTASFPGDRNGGILRIMTDDGKQICSATQFANGDTYKYSGYNNSSPAVAEVDGAPLIVFGSTGPVQTGAGANQIVAYDGGCRPRWASPPLAGPAEPSPTFADVSGTGRVSVLALVGVRDGANTYPRVVELNPSTGVVVHDTGSALKSYGGLLAYTPSMSIVTADVNNDGAQDLFVPSRQGAFVVLDGRTFGVLTTINTNMAIQNTPIITATANGIRFTIAGYNGLGSQISSYTMVGGVLGQRGWREFGNNPQLTGLQGSLAGPYRELLEGQVLWPGQALRYGGASLTMQTDGNLVARDSGGVPRWSSGTFQAGSRLATGVDGNLEVRSPSNALLWQAGVGLGGVERTVLNADGSFRVYSCSWGSGRQLTRCRVIWTSSGPQPVLDHLLYGETLPPGRSLTSPDRQHRLVMQFDGNLVLWRGSQVVWQSFTSHPSGRTQLVFGLYGELYLVVPGGPVLRDFGTGFKGADRFNVTNNGNLTVTSPFGDTLWQARVIK
jgi:hypothetical protein